MRDRIAFARVVGARRSLVYRSLCLSCVGLVQWPAAVVVGVGFNRGSKHNRQIRRDSYTHSYSVIYNLLKKKTLRQNSENEPDLTARHIIE